MLTARIGLKKQRKVQACQVPQKCSRSLRVKSLGGVCLNTMTGNGKNGTKLAEKILNNRLPVGFGLPNFVHICET